MDRFREEDGLPLRAYHPTRPIRNRLQPISVYRFGRLRDFGARSRDFRARSRGTFAPVPVVREIRKPIENTSRRDKRFDVGPAATTPSRRRRTLVESIEPVARRT